MSELKKIEKEVLDYFGENFSIAEFEGLRKASEERFIKYLVTVLVPLGFKKITFEQALKSIKQEIEIMFETPSKIPNITAEDELVQKDAIYLKSLRVLREYFKQMIFDADEEERMDTLNKTYPDYFEEIFTKINIELHNYSERKKWVKVFHSKEHFDAFEYILSSFAIEEHSKKLFSGFWYEFGGNQILMRCTAKTYTEWVYQHYLPHEEKKSENLTRSHCDSNHQFRRQIRRYKATHKDENIFKPTYARK